ncbi:hypothetical protein ACFC3F_07830 [Microbacterium sp. NPDC055910]|uniref:hypothetical protein n=1 Tax=Microbacterium sp. NPDC055910 TaxID=3345659 RepID=UPI0035E3A3DE
MLDVGARDAYLGVLLTESIGAKYLGLVSAEALDGVRSHAGPLAERFHKLDPLFRVSQSSADVLVVRADRPLSVAGFSELAPFRWIAVERGKGRRSAATRLALGIARRRGRISAVDSWTDSAHAFDVFRLHHEPPLRPRVYFSPVWGVTGLARRLEDAGLEYVVLRWFTQLPQMAPGEDLDILVRDEHAETFREIVGAEPGTIPIDLYSETGLDGYDFRGAAYYVPSLAKTILDRSVIHASGMRVPAPADHLHSLAYHVLYHKGFSAGLASSLPHSPLEEPAEHDYAAALTEAAESAGSHIPLDMEGLDDYLGQQKWRPPLDALRRLSSSNDWAARRIDVRKDASGVEGELAVFVIRERLEEVVSLDDVRGILEHLGFQIVFTHRLDAAARGRAAAHIRGGNWGRGPYPASGGGPSLVIAALHFAPESVDPALKSRYPHLTNADILAAKVTVRDLVDATLGESRAFNGMHSADDETEAWHYLELAAPESVARVREIVAAGRAAQGVPHGTTRTLSRGRRARVDVRATDAGIVVRKTFVPGARRHLERELAALDALATSDIAPEVLDRGEDWFEMPYYRNVLTRRRRLLPLPILRRMVAVLDQLHAAGFDLVDAKPDNFIIDEDGRLLLVDLEFAYATTGEAEARRTLVDGPEFSSPDPRRYPDVPVGDSSYGVRWLPHSGMPPAVLISGGAFAQHRHRSVYRIRQSLWAPGAPPRALLRYARDALRGWRRGMRQSALSLLNARSARGQGKT